MSDTNTAFDAWFRENIPTGDISVYRAVELVWNRWQEDVKRLRGEAARARASNYFTVKAHKILAEACGHRENWTKYDHALLDLAREADDACCGDVAQSKQEPSIDELGGWIEHSLAYGISSKDGRVSARNLLAQFEIKPRALAVSSTNCAGGK